MGRHLREHPHRAQDADQRLLAPDVDEV